MTTLVALEKDIVVVLVEDLQLAQELRDAIRRTPLAVRGPELIGAAATVLVDAAGDAFARVADVRRRARSDAAIVVLVRTPADASAAYAAGAFACVHPPIVAEELAGLLSSALDSRAAMSQATDLIRKLRLEAEFASVGRISAGLTHEVASPLAAAVLNLDQIREQLAARAGDRPDPILEEPLQDLATSLDRIARVVRSLNAACRAPPTLVAVDIAAAVLQVLEWTAPSLAGVQVEQVVDPLHGLADPTMLGQLLLNLVTNAVHAARMLPSPRVRLHVYASRGHAVVSVRDNGPGIPEEFQDRIFEPFFTTRRGQGGTGLGLSLCREYAQRMGAILSVWSVPGRGSCFRLELRPA